MARDYVALYETVLNHRAALVKRWRNLRKSNRFSLWAATRWPDPRNGLLLTDIVRVADEYYVRASSALADDRTRVLKCGDTFAVFNRYGDIEDLGVSQFGLFHAESRHLSRFTMRLNQKQGMLLSSTIRDDNAFLSVDLTNVDTAVNGENLLPRGTVHIFRAQFLRKASCYEHIRVLNYGLEPVQFMLTLQFDADFADIFEVRGTKRAAQRRAAAGSRGRQRRGAGYKGLDGVMRSTRLEFSPQPDSLTPAKRDFRSNWGRRKRNRCFAAWRANAMAAPRNLSYRFHDGVRVAQPRLRKGSPQKRL